MPLPRPSFILMDIEGTTTAIDFVHKVLFPYSAEHMGRFVEAHAQEPAVAACLEAAADIMQAEGAKKPSLTEIKAALLRWIQDDRKATPLKELQGYLWQEGYAAKAYEGHLYPDVLPALQEWRAAGIKLGIYSSGSVQAQKLLFGHTPYGDINPLLSAYFDTTSGAKREASSYQHIATSLHLSPSRILFLSDIPAELHAAAEAGLTTAQILRPPLTTAAYEPAFADFTSIVFA